MKRPYTFFDWTQSLCTTCHRLIDAKIVFENDSVYLLKHCFNHGNEKVLISTDIPYYKRSRTYLKPGDMPQKFNMPVKYGCPYDCGLCTDHEQHSCLSILEITDRCNLSCPTCFTSSTPTSGKHRSMEEIEFMLDTIVANEGEPDIVQVSGGEPTVHPQFFEILDAAKKRPIRHLMVNTNGVLIASDEKFVERLAAYKPGFEIYLQFDSLNSQTLKDIRGEDLTRVRQRALDHLNKYNISTTLVVTVQKNRNLPEMGSIIDFALKQPCVRGVTFQPMQFAGRTENSNNENRVTLSEVRTEILKQSSIFTDEDIIPVPCNPDTIAMAYALKINGEVMPLSRPVDPQALLDDPENTIVYEKNIRMRDEAVKLFSTSHSDTSAAANLKSLLCCLPQIESPQLGYDNVFRVIIKQFLDAGNFDVRSVKRSCVHIVTPQGKMIPIETMNLFYRPEKSEQLKSLQRYQLSKQEAL